MPLQLTFASSEVSVHDIPTGKTITFIDVGSGLQVVVPLDGLAAHRLAALLDGRSALKLAP